MSKLLTAIGLMSGTSLDGIDVALVRSDGEAALERGAARTYAYDEAQRRQLKAAIAAARGLADRAARPAPLAAIEAALTDWHGAAVERFLAETGVARTSVDLVGFHGQTVLHRPEIGLTVQLGCGALLARRLGLPVVSDLRAADVAAGGQGAPLVPVYHRALAAALAPRPIAFVNIGGVANMTWIGADGTLVAFDTGPGNALINDWCERHLGAAMDEGGALAARGASDARALAALLDDPYFALPVPKSLDRNAFAVDCRLGGLSPADGAATLTRFTAAAIARGAAHVPARPSLYVVCGGGRHNPTLMRAIRDAFAAAGESVVTAEEAGFDGDATEAEAWAYLAIRSSLGLPISFPGTTGVRQPLSGGILSPP